jgi:hypothetical protein
MLSLIMLIYDFSFLRRALVEPSSVKKKEDCDFSSTNVLPERQIPADPPLARAIQAGATSPCSSLEKRGCAGDFAIEVDSNQARQPIIESDC